MIYVGLMACADFGPHLTDGEKFVTVTLRVPVDTPIHPGTWHLEPKPDAPRPSWAISSKDKS